VFIFFQSNTETFLTNLKITLALLTKFNGISSSNLVINLTPLIKL